MKSTLQTAEARPTTDPMSLDELAALVDDARALRRAAEAGTIQPLLRGRKIGVLCAAEPAGIAAAALVERAAVELGAQVAHIRPGLLEHSAARDVQQAARLLGRLYDAVVCEGLPSSLVQCLRAEAGVPVCDRIASPSHPIARAARMLGPASAAQDNRRFLLQALLLKALA